MSAQYRSFLFAVSFLWLLGPAAVVGEAQDYVLQAGAPPFTVSEPVEMGFLNLANGNIHLEIPLGSFPQRGGRPFTASFVYDSRIWTSACANHWYPGNVYQQCSSTIWAGWRLVTSADLGKRTFTDTQYSCGSTYGGYRYKYNNFAFVFPDGSTKSFPGITTWYVDLNCAKDGYKAVTNGVSYASDDSGYYMVVSNYYTPTVYAPDGTQVASCCSMLNPEDSNGNYLSQSSSVVTDTLGRKPVIVTASCNGNVNLTCYDILNAQGGTSRWIATTTSVPVSTSFTNGNTEYSGNMTVLQSLALPDGTSYTFGYDSGSSPGYYGELTGITLPTGGQINYAYTNYKPCREVNRWVSSRTSGTGTWTYTPQVSTCPSGSTNGQQQMSVTKPSGDNFVYTFATSTSLGIALTQVQAYTGAVSPANLVANVATTWDGFLTHKLSETITVPIPGGTSLNTTKQFAYDSAGGVDSYNQGPNLIQLSEWKYYTGTLPSTPDLITSTSYTGSISSYLGKNIINKPTSVTVKTGGGTQLSQTNYSYDSTSLTSVTGTFNHDDANFGTGDTVRGNLTQIQRWVGGSTYLTTTMAYDTTGQLGSVQDPAGNTTLYGYSDIFFDDNGSNPPSPHTGAPLTNAYLTSINHPLSLAESFGYYYGTGQNESHTDFNHNSTYYHYVDFFDRPTATKFPDGGSTTVTYSGQNQSDVYTAVNGSTTKHDELTLDGLGRKNQTILVSDPDGSDTVSFGYNNLGQVSSVTNPHRSASSSTDGTTTFAYDTLGRVTTTTEADGSQTHSYFGPSVTSNGGIGSQLCSSATYGLGYPTLLVDEAQKKRQSWADGFGRLIEVDEPDSTGALSVPTCYAYDLLDNLTGVLQNGSRQRTFVYDSVSRLTSATNPESGTTTYKYDSDTACSSSNFAGLLVSRVDARGIRTCMYYDALNRLGGKSYSDGTETVYYDYDTPPSWMSDSTNVKGRLANTSNSSGGSTDGKATAATFSYDAMGRIVRQWEQTPSASPGGYFVYQAYDLAGNPTSITYPSGRTVNFIFSGANRPIKGTFTNASPIAYDYLSSATYAPNGAPATMVFGNGLTETSTYNQRFQPLNQQVASSAITPLYRSYSFYDSASHNNGNVASITDNLAPGRTQNFIYDNLNRILTAKTSATSGSDCWAQQFGYDAWSNLLTASPTQSGCSMSQLNVSVNTKNQIINSGFSYDAAGNLLTDGTNSYVFDAENRIGSVNSGAATYIYDPVGKRARKQVGSDWTEYIYSDGIVVAEKKPNGDWSDYVYVGGRRITRADSYEDGIQIQGTNSTTGVANAFYFPNAGGLQGYAIQNGDKLLFRQYQNSVARGGIFILFTDGSTPNWVTYDQDGQQINSDNTTNAWHYRRVDLSQYTGKTISIFSLVTDGNTQAGTWTVIYGDIVLLSPDGTVRPIYNGQSTVPAFSLYSSNPGATSNVTYSDRHLSNISWNANTTTNYYSSDHLGSARTILSYWGYPTSSATYLPFGQEWNPQQNVNHYKFTGKERDFESGLDNFDARFDSSSMGRFMSPDPDNAGADLLAPQSWNAYSYVLNNPLNAIDPTGLDCVYLNDAGTGVDGPKGVDRNSNSGECHDNGGTWFDGIINSNSVRTDSNSDWVSAEGVVGDIGSNQQFSCGGSACGQDALDSFVNSITGGPSSVTVTDESGNLSPEAALTLKLAGEEASYYAGCAAIPGAGLLAGGTAVKLGQPVAGSKPFVTPGSSIGTSPASEALRDAMPRKLPFRVPTPVGGPGTGTALRMGGTRTLGAAVGRYVPFLGLAVTAYSAYKMNQCLNSKP